MPRGNSADGRNTSNSNPCISIFLQSAEAKVLPPSILPRATFKLSIINRAKPDSDISKGVHDHVVLPRCIFQRIKCTS
jgi:hypothetical protein